MNVFERYIPGPPLPPLDQSFMKATTSERTPVPVQEEMDMDFEVDWWSQLEEDHSLESEEENAYLAGGEDGFRGEREAEKEKEDTIVEASAPLGQASHSPGKHPGGRVPLLQLGCCDYGSSILDQPSRPTTLISLGVIGISADGSRRNPFIRYSLRSVGIFVYPLPEQ